MLNFKPLDHSLLIDVNDSSNAKYSRVALTPLTNTVYISNLEFEQTKVFLPNIKADLKTIYNDTLQEGLVDFIKFIHHKTNLNQGAKLKNCIVVVDRVKTNTIKDKKNYHGSFDLTKVMYVYGFHLVEVD